MAGSCTAIVVVLPILKDLAHVVPYVHAFSVYSEGSCREEWAGRGGYVARKVEVRMAGMAQWQRVVCGVVGWGRCVAAVGDGVNWYMERGRGRRRAKGEGGEREEKVRQYVCVLGRAGGVVGGEG